MSRSSEATVMDTGHRERKVETGGTKLIQFFGAFSGAQ